MGETTHISWADHTHNHWLGCTKVSNGELGACEGCYAKVLVEDRFGRAVFGGPGKGVGTRALTSEANRRKPLAWDRKAATDGTRPFVFCSSLADVFDSDVPPEWRADLFDTIRRTPNLVWLLLTKRPGNIRRLFASLTLDKERPVGEPLAPPWPRNAAIGCTVVTQAEADRDIPKLLKAKAELEPAFAFLSMEPLMGPVDLNNLDCGAKRHGAHGWSALWPLGPDRPALDWIITGGETDQGSHKARPSNPQWFRDIRDQCAAAGVPFHHKQNGEWLGQDQLGWLSPQVDVSRCTESADTIRVGKRLAGRTLDGVIHDARPVLRDERRAAA